MFSDMAKYMTYNAAVGNLQRLFKGNLDSDVVSLHEIAVANDRENYTTDKNKTWVGNMLTHLKHYQLALGDYTKQNGRDVLSGVKLTDEGRKALRADAGAGTPAQRVISLESIARDIKEFEKQNPSLKIEFRAEIRTDGSVVTNQ